MDLMLDKNEYTNNSIAKATGYSVSRIRERGFKEDWKHERRYFGRTSCKVYQFKDLPKDIQNRIKGEKPEAKIVKEDEIDTGAVIKELMRENRQLKNRLVRGRGIEDLIIQKVIEVHKFPAIHIPPKAPRDLGVGRSEIPCLHLSDIHLGKVTPDYNSMVAKERVNILARKVVEITNLRRNNATIDELRVYLGGDMIEGEVGNFPSQPYHIDQAVIDQATNDGVVMLSNVLSYFLEHFKKIKVCCVVGNHGRGHSKNAVGHEKSNWDRVLYNILKINLVGLDETPRKEMRERLSFDIADEFWCVDRVFNWGNLIVHGDDMRPGSMGIPWYGVTRSASGWAQCTEIPAWDYLWLGHFHTVASFTVNNKVCLANGSTESKNQYALKKFAAQGLPCQRLAFFNKGKGLISDEWIYLVNKVPEIRRYSNE